MPTQGPNASDTESGSLSEAVQINVTASDAASVVEQPNARLTQAGVEALIATSPNARLTQAGVETLITANPTARLTQAGVETLVTTNPAARLTQAGVEVVLSVLGPLVIDLTGSPAGARTLTAGAGVQIVGSATVVAGQATAKTLATNPVWSVEVYGPLAEARASAPAVPDPSFDIRPGAASARTSVVRPWLGPPFLASDSFAGAVVLPSVPYDVRGSTAGFTTEAGEPQPTSGATGATGWYQFTPATSGFYEFSLLNSNFDTTLAIYKQTGTGLSGLVEVASNNDLVASQSHAYAYLSAGQTYWIQIGGTGGATGVYELQVALISGTCQPVQLGGTVTANFWQGYTGGFPYPSVVGGFGGAVEVARTACPTNWDSVTVNLTLVSSTAPTDQWFLGWEVHDRNDNLLGGRGSFFGGNGAGISSWQDRVQVGVGQTVTSTVPYSLGAGGDTTQAAWFVLYAFPVDPYIGFRTAQCYATASFGGVCPLPTSINPLRPRTWVWWQ